MIHQALKFTVTMLNQHLEQLLAQKGEKVVLSGLTEADGSPAAKSNDKLVCTLVNIEEEATLKNGPTTLRQGEHSVYMKPGVNLNLHILFSGNFSEYAESLKFISHTIGFFQTNNVFTSTVYPTLNTEITKLTFELVSFDYQTLSYIWGLIGAKYQPSVVYKIRMLHIASDQVYEEIPVITGIQSTSEA